MQHVVSDPDDNTITTGKTELLDVQDDFQVTWVPYTSGDTLPFKAVMGGFITGGGNGDTNTFVIRTTINGLKIGGYYNPKTNRGYCQYHAIYKLTQMDVLVLMWGDNRVLDRRLTAV